MVAKNHSSQKKVTRSGTLKSTINPWKIETITKSLPQALVRMGRVVSMVVAPPTEMGASGPNHRTMSGAPSRVITSRTMLASSATVPRAAPLYWVISTLESE